jgi:hypothetical protein
MMARLSPKAHRDLAWRIHEIARGFRVEDVWAIRASGSKTGDLPALLAALSAAEEHLQVPWLVRLLFAMRLKLGELLGLDVPGSGVGSRVPTLRDALPGDLGPAGGDAGGGFGPFTPVYQLEDEVALEHANAMVHAILHLGWVVGAAGGRELRLAVLVKPNGLLGRVYMAAIAPARQLVVMPWCTRRLEDTLRARNADEDGATVTVTSAVGTSKVDASLLKLGSLSRVDYVDHFTLAPVSGREATPEQWARGMFGDVPVLAERFLWHGILRLRLSEGRSPSTVAGWQIAEHGPDWIRLETASRWATANLVVRATTTEISLTTFMGYDRPLAGLLWRPLSALHRRLVPGLLRGTVERMSAANLAHTSTPGAPSGTGECPRCGA